MNPKEYEVNVYFNNNLITTDPKLDTVIVTNDYNSIELKFNFDIEATKYVFKLLNPSNEVALISEIEDNTLTIGKGYITEKGLYQFEIAGYGSDSRLTNYFVYSFMVRQELIESDEIELPEEKVAVLDTLINEVSTLYDGNNEILNQKEPLHSVYRYDIEEDLANGTSITVPATYVLDSNLTVFYCGERLIKDIHYTEVDETTISILFDIEYNADFNKFFDFLIKYEEVSE